MTKTIGLCMFLCAGAAAVAQVAPGEDAVAPTGASPYANPAMPLPEALGDLIGGPFEVSTLIPSAGALGAEYAWGYIWVSARNNALTVGQPNVIGKFRPDGTLVRVYNQGVLYNTVSDARNSPWGGRDGAADEANNALYFGHELGHLAKYDYNPITGDIAFNSTTQIPGIVNIIRALCIRADNGNFLSADFGSPLNEFRTTGLVTQYANNFSAVGTSLAAYGFAWVDDGLEANDKLWVWHQHAPGALLSLGATEVDFTTVPPSRTGREFFPQLPPGYTGALAGGADADCEGGRVRLIGLVQGTPNDYFVYHDLDAACGSGCPCACNYDTTTGQNVCDIFDFLEFQNAYDRGEPCACDTDLSTGPNTCDIFDFLEFQNGYSAGCP